MLSNNLEFKKLLLLHGKDRRMQSMEIELNSLPSTIANINSKIEIEKETINSANLEFREIEVNSSALENEINSLLELITRQKNKQLEVKKNEEYSALANEIDNLKQKLSTKEDEQIETLLKLDDAKETLDIAKSKISENSQTEEPFLKKETS